jgi:hypothetical protein
MPTERDRQSMGEGDTLINALIGAVVTVILTFTIFSPILGGGIAGYLQNGTREEGARVGAISGVIAAVPVLALAFLFGGLFLTGSMLGFGGMMGGGIGVPRAFGILVLFGLVWALVWTIGLSALGGYLGAYIATETDVGA